MTLPNIIKDVAAKRMTIEKQYAAAQATVWNAWADGEQLARWWGPEGYPASSVSHDFRVGGHWHYYMTSPEGEKLYGKFNYTEISPRDLLRIHNYTSDESGAIGTHTPPSNWKIEFAAVGERATKLVVTIQLASEDEFAAFVASGFEYGFASGLSNLEKLLGEG